VPCRSEVAATSDGMDYAIAKTMPGANYGFGR
jgi:hypothetical protein